MSTGTRVPNADAVRVARACMERWGMTGDDCFIVGSVRRQCETVGDVELLAPTAAGYDSLYHRIAGTMRGDGLFAPTEGTVGRALRGLSPGFLACSLVVNPWPDCELGLQVFRYTPQNLGWQMLMRTGPAEFGQWFLGKWKAHFNIPFGDKGRASIDGHLVDAGGRIVPVFTEEAAFDRCAIGYIPPERRDAFMAAQKGRH